MKMTRTNGTDTAAGVRRTSEPGGFEYADTALLRIGRRVARPDAPHWGTEQVTGDTPIVAFTHAPIRVRFEGGDPEILTGATLATPGGRHAYVSEPLSDRGERTTFIRFKDDTMARMCAAHDPAASDRPDRPVRWTHSPADDRAAAAALRVSSLVFERGSAIDPLWLEEMTLAIVQRAIDASFRARARTRPPTDDPVGAEAVRAVCAHMAAHFGGPLGVQQLATIAGYSPGYFCRKFRRHTNMTIHQYLTRIRLMAVVERLPGRAGQISRLAQETGFASHAHLTSVFSRAIGATPTEVREDGLAWWRDQIEHDLRRARGGDA